MAVSSILTSDDQFQKQLRMAASISVLHWKEEEKLHKYINKNHKHNTKYHLINNSAIFNKQNYGHSY